MEDHPVAVSVERESNTKTNTTETFITYRDLIDGEILVEDSLGRQKGLQAPFRRHALEPRRHRLDTSGAYVLYWEGSTVYISTAKASKLAKAPPPLHFQREQSVLVADVDQPVSVRFQARGGERGDRVPPR